MDFNNICYVRRTNIIRSRGGSVSRVTGLDDRGSILDRGRNLVTSPPGPDWFWGLPSLLSIGYRDKEAGA